MKILMSLTREICNIKSLRAISELVRCRRIIVVPAIYTRVNSVSLNRREPPQETLPCRTQKRATFHILPGLRVPVIKEVLIWIWLVGYTCEWCPL